MDIVDETFEMEGAMEVDDKDKGSIEKEVSYGLDEEAESDDDDDEPIHLDHISSEEYAKHQEAQIRLLECIMKEKEVGRIEVMEDDGGQHMIECTDLAIPEEAGGGGEIQLKSIDPNEKPISQKTFKELGIITEPPFEGAIEGRDYVELVDEVDGEGNPTGKKFIPGDCDHVRSRLDPYYGDKNKSDAEVAKEKDRFKQYMLSRYGIQDSSTGEVRLADPNDTTDLETLAEQRGWTVRKKGIDDPDAPELSGGFGTSPEDQGFQRSSTIPVDSLMFKLISYNNTLKYEMQLVSEIGLDSLIKLPPYFAILSTAKYPNVAHSHAVLRYAKIFEDMFVDKWPFDKEKDYTMAGTGKPVGDSLPELALLSLEEREMKQLGIDSGRDGSKMIEPSTPTDSPEIGGVGDVEDYIREHCDNPPEESVDVGAVKEGARKKKLKDFFIKDDPSPLSDAFDWCPNFGECPFSTMLDGWFALTIEQTNKEIESIREAQKKRIEEDIGKDEPTQETPPNTNEEEEDEGDMQDEDEGVKPGDDELGERSPGEPISDWLCSYGGPDQRDMTGISSFFARFVREGWLIKLFSKETGPFVIANCLYEIVEHWKTICMMDIATRGGFLHLFPGGKELEVGELSNLLRECVMHTWANAESGGFSYLDKISDFLGEVVTDYVLKRIWKEPKEEVNFNYPSRGIILKLLMKAEQFIDPLKLEDIPIPSCDDCESFHHEWVYHWKNRQLANMETNLVSDVSNKINDSLIMYASEMTTMSHMGRETLDIQKSEELLPKDPIRQHMNGSFILDISNPILEGDRLFTYPKLLHETFLSFHTHLVTKVAVLSLYLQMLSARWVPLSVRKTFGYIPSEDPFMDVVKREQVTELSMKRHVFMRRANMQVKLRSVGLEASSPIYNTLILREDETYPDINLDEEASRCLFGDVTFPEIDLMTDTLRYLVTVSNPGARPSDETFYTLIKEAVGKKAKFMLPDDVDVGSQFTSEEMMRMIEVTEQFKDPVKRDASAAVDGEKNPGKRTKKGKATSKTRGRHRRRGKKNRS